MCRCLILITFSILPYLCRILDLERMEVETSQKNLQDTLEEWRSPTTLTNLTWVSSGKAKFTTVVTKNERACVELQSSWSKETTMDLVTLSKPNQERSLTRSKKYKWKLPHSLQTLKLFSTTLPCHKVTLRGIHGPLSLFKTSNNPWIGISCDATRKALWYWQNLPHSHSAPTQIVIQRVLWKMWTL